MTYFGKGALAKLWEILKATFVAQEAGKGLSSNDYSDADRNKLAGLQPGLDGKDGKDGAPGADGKDGAPGADGAPGSQWYSGTALSGTSSTQDYYSSSSLSGSYRLGDYYLNSSYGYVYRCTTAGTGSAAKWTYQGSIRGATGATGSTGPQGPSGSLGFKILYGKLPAQGSVAGGKYADYSITFSRAFSSVPIVVVGFEAGSTNGAFGKCCCAARSITASGFVIRFFNGDSNNRDPLYHWIAIGT